MSPTSEPDRIELDADDIIVIESLARGHTHEQAGAQINRSAKYVQRLFSKPAFNDAVNQRKHELASQLRARYDHLGDLALDVIEEAMHSDNPSTRLAAARFALQKRLELHAKVDLNERLDAIESIAHKNGHLNT